MSTFVFSVRPDLRENVDRASVAGVWDMVDRHGIEPGDDVYFWITGSARGSWGVVSHATVAAAPRQLDGDPKPWAEADTIQYQYRVLLTDFEPLENPGVRWTQIPGAPGRLNPVTKVGDEAAGWFEEQLAAALRDTSATGGRVDTVLTDPVRVDLPPHGVPSSLGSEQPAPDAVLPERSFNGIARKVDRASRDAGNRRLGEDGEKLVVEHLRADLRSRGRGDLADQVEHIAHTRGDGAGYDIRAFDPDGTEIYVEVKTTRGGADTPFFVSRNEVLASEVWGDAYRLYRVFGWGDERPDFYVVRGPLSQTCQLGPTAYEGLPGQA